MKLKKISSSHSVFMFTSHETKEDYSHFFSELNQTAFDIHGICFDPEYIVSDASKSMANAINKHYKRCRILMCWFHVRYNLRKRKASMGKYYRAVMKQVEILHQCRNQVQFNVHLKKFEKVTEKTLPGFHNYFKKQWVDSKFSNWVV